MAFVDELTIEVAAGRGGDGVVRWVHSAAKDKGGPGGGDGGQGGDVILEGVRDLGALASHRFIKKFKAESGDAGHGNNKHGADGEDCIIKVPVGSVATDSKTKETYEILSEGQKIVVAKGGAGGFGNDHFKSSINQNPEESTKGKAGGKTTLTIVLKLIADVGLIGFPNAGKSSLLNSLTRAKSKIGAYPFTTLDPHLGDFYGFLLADIPGLISGASEGKGLGSKFLKHIERTGILVHLVSSEQDNPVASYKAIRAELGAFGQGISEKNELVVLSKTDMVSPEEVEKKKKALESELGVEVLTVSVLDDDLLKSFSDTLAQHLKERR